MALYAFDGTWNSDEVDDVQDTNVVRFKELYMGNTPEYMEGVGTRFGAVGKVLGGIFGLGGQTRIDEMYDELCENWKNDKVIDIIGFSRGAALAVHFANRIGKEGIILDDGTREDVKIRFLGLWDIVGSFGLAIDTIIDFQEINLGWEIDTVHNCVEHCYHAMALDERRESFNVTRLDPEKKYSNISEVWFHGVHSDIGGGNENILRSNITLQWMLEKAKACGLPLDEIKAKNPRYSKNDQFAPISENKDVRIDQRRKELAGDERHQSALPFYLKTGQSLTCRVIAKMKHNWSGVTLQDGAQYTFEVAENDTWKDAEIVCGPGGWKTEDLPWYKEGIVQFFEKHKRHETANWFALVGALGNDDDELFLIGDSSKIYNAEKDADLYLFANDMLSKYGNNDGYLEVTITRIS